MICFVRFQDAINDQGLFITTLADRVPPLTQHMAMAGGRNAGLSSRQVLLLLASKCRTVAEAKKEVLTHSVKMDFGLHWLMADASGGASVIEVDKHGCFLFADASARTPNRPFPVTNHPLHPAGYKEARRYFKPDEAYDTFNRYEQLTRAIERHPDGYSRRDAEKLLDRVVCAYQRPEPAGAHRMNTLTLWSLIANLGKKELVIRFFLDDGAADPDMPNHLLPEWATYHVGFGSCRREDSTSDLPPPVTATGSSHEPVVPQRAGGIGC
jgi:penicillin V acylase-like amidase (Ntn superfamily)